MNAEALTIMETDDEEEDEEERINKNRPQQSQNQNGKKQNQVFTKDLPSMEDNIVTPIDTTWSIGCTTPQTEITEITIPDTHIMQEPDNLPLCEDPFAILIDTPQPIGKEPSHIPVSEGKTPDIKISSRSNNLSLAHTITKLADSVSKLNQLLEKARGEK